MDIFPTAAELAGVAVPENLDGKSLLSVLKGEQEQHHEALVWAQNRGQWVIRKGKWKLTHKVGWEHRDFVVQPNGDVVEAEKDYVYSDEPQLFDLEADIAETNNLIDQHPDVAAELRALYSKWDAQMPGPLSPDGKPRGSRKKKPAKK
jgi:arylsulfatase A-like enzyme